MIRVILILGAALVFVLLLKRVSAGGDAADIRSVANTDDGVRDLLRMKKKIAAIKLYREIHGVGLKEAKEAVERMAQE